MLPGVFVCLLYICSTCKLKGKLELKIMKNIDLVNKNSVHIIAELARLHSVSHRL